MPTIVLRGRCGSTARSRLGRGGAAEELELGAVLDELDSACPALARRIRDEQGQLRRYVNIYIDGEDARRIGGLNTPVPPAPRC